MKVMENNFDLIDLNEDELRECNGGFVMLIIKIFTPSVKGIIGFFDGLKEGYERGTSTP
jgi:hypothetical protein